MTELQVNGGITPRSASLFFRDAAHVLSNLISLHISILYPFNTYLNDDDWDPSVDGIDHIHSYLTSITKLRDLSSSYFMLHFYLPELGALPCLRMLGINMPDNMNLPAVSLSKDAFPVLRTVSFTRIGLDQANAMWQVLPMVENLADVMMVLDVPNQTLSTQPETRANFFHLLSSSSPYIIRLSLDFPPLNGYSRDLVAHKIGKNELTLLGQLPLQELYMRNVCIEHPNSCSLLAATFPRIRVLHWPGQSAQCCDLSLFADNPNLEHLSLCLDLRKPPDPEVVRRGRYRPQRALQALEIDPDNLAILEHAGVYPFVM